MWGKNQKKEFWELLGFFFAVGMLGWFLLRDSQNSHWNSQKKLKKPPKNKKKAGWDDKVGSVWGKNQKKGFWELLGFLFCGWDVGMVFSVEFPKFPLEFPKKKFKKKEKEKGRMGMRRLEICGEKTKKGVLGIVGSFFRGIPKIPAGIPKKKFKKKKKRKKKIKVGWG